MCSVYNKRILSKVKKIGVEYNSDWQQTTVELLKTLHGYGEENYNPSIGGVDYVVVDDDGKHLMRALVGEDGLSSPCYLEDVNQLIEAMDERNVDEALVLADRFTSSARRKIEKKENVDYLSPGVEYRYRVGDLAYAIQQKTLELCREICGAPPGSEEECRGREGENYTCPVRRISDDATFHAEMRWDHVLLEDFQRLLELQENEALLEAM